MVLGSYADAGGSVRETKDRLSGWDAELLRGMPPGAMISGHGQSRRRWDSYHPPVMRTLTDLVRMGESNPLLLYGFPTFAVVGWCWTNANGTPFAIRYHPLVQIRSGPQHVNGNRSRQLRGSMRHLYTSVAYHADRIQPSRPSAIVTAATVIFASFLHVARRLSSTLASALPYAADITSRPPQAYWRASSSHRTGVTAPYSRMPVSKIMASHL